MSHVLEALKSVWMGTNFVCISTSANPGDFHCRKVTEREQTTVFKQSKGGQLGDDGKRGRLLECDYTAVLQLLGFIFPMVS